MSAWFKCFPERILDSYDKLDSDQRAAAYTLTMLIYQHDGPLSLSEGNLAGRCGFNLRKYRRVIGELTALGKFYVTPSGALSNERADELLEHRRAARDFGVVGGKKRAENAKAKSNSIKIEREQKPARFANTNEKTGQNNGTEQGSLGFGFKYIEGDIPEAKASGPSACDVIFQGGKELLSKQGVGTKAAGVVLGKLRKVKGAKEAERIISALLANPPLDASDYLWAIVNGKAPAAPPRPTVALCRLGDLRWCHDWATGENFTTDAEGRHLLDRELNEAERSEVARAVDAAQTMRRAA